jgi:hypothetical protein
VDGDVASSPFDIEGEAEVEQDVVLTIEYEIDGSAQPTISETKQFTPIAGATTQEQEQEEDKEKDKE